MDHSINTKPLLEEDSNESDEDTPSSSGVTGGDISLKHLEIKDWYYSGYITFYILGIVTLLPYTFFVTANDYWMYKLRDTSLNSTVQTNLTTLQAEFTTYLTIAASGPSVIFMIINSIVGHRISLPIRMIGSLSVILLSFIVTTVLVEVDTDSWQDTFFTITLATVVLVNVLGAILSAGLLGIAGRFAPKYVSAVISGQALGGLFPALVYIASLAIGATSTHSALLYFCIANVTILISLIAYCVLSRSLFFNYHMLMKDPANVLNYDPMEARYGSDVPTLQISVQQVFSKTWVYGVSAMIVYTVSISIYPGVTVLISSVQPTSSLWTDKFFVPVTAFLVFSVWDYVGRVVAGLFNWPVGKKWWVFAASVLRMAFIPVFLLCNAHPRHNLPVLVDSDYAYVAVTCFFGFTNGYMTNIININMFKHVDETEKDVASSIISTFISAGCAAGAILCFVFLRIM